MNAVHYVLFFFLTVSGNYYGTAEEATVLSHPVIYQPSNDSSQQTLLQTSGNSVGSNNLEVLGQTTNVQNTNSTDVVPQSVKHPDSDDMDYTGEEFQDNRLRLMYPGHLITLNETTFKTFRPLQNFSNTSPLPEMTSYETSDIEFRSLGGEALSSMIQKQHEVSHQEVSVNVSLMSNNEKTYQGETQNEDKKMMSPEFSTKTRVNTVEDKKNKLLHQVTPGNSTSESAAAVLLPNGTVLSQKESHNSTTTHKNINEDGMLNFENIKKNSTKPDTNDTSLENHAAEITEASPTANVKLTSLSTIINPIPEIKSTTEDDGKNYTNFWGISPITVNASPKTTKNITEGQGSGEISSNKLEFQENSEAEQFSPESEENYSNDNVPYKITTNITAENGTKREIPDSDHVNKTQSNVTDKTSTTEIPILGKVSTKRTGNFIAGNSTNTDIPYVNVNTGESTFTGNISTIEIPNSEKVSSEKTGDIITRYNSTTESTDNVNVNAAENAVKGKTTTQVPELQKVYSKLTDEIIMGNNSTTERTFTKKAPSNDLGLFMETKTFVPKYAAEQTSKAASNIISNKNKTAVTPETNQDDAYEEIEIGSAAEEEEDFEGGINSTDSQTNENGPVVIILPGGQTNRGEELIPSNTLLTKQFPQIMASNLLPLLINLTTITAINAKNGQNILKELDKQSNKIQQVQQQTDSIYKYLIKTEV